jgi:uncharacterized protein
VLTHILEALAQLDPTPGLVLKGGTALRLTFYEDYRYSADLDFSVVGLAAAEGIAVLRRALERCARGVGLPRLALRESDPLLIEYVGPLSRQRTIKLDLVDDELVLDTTQRPLILRYADQAGDGSTITTYTLEEIAAEKLRCVIQRLLCRDIADLHRVFVREGVDVEKVWPLFEEKTRAKDLDPGRFRERLSARESRYRRRWVQELADLEPDVAPFETVIRQLRRELRNHV